jgi:uncharacterized protein YbaA (DUF1428 family)
MADYIDGFVFPIAKIHVEVYKDIAMEVADIWKEYGAIQYVEYLSDGCPMEGTMPFAQAVKAKPNEVIVFGWVVFPSKEIRDKANELVQVDNRMIELVAPLILSPQFLILLEWLMAGSNRWYTPLPK